jgi:hypothetical protein
MHLTLALARLAFSNRNREIELKKLIELSNIMEKTKSPGVIMMSYFNHSLAIECAPSPLQNENFSNEELD